MRWLAGIFRRLKDDYTNPLTGPDLTQEKVQKKLDNLANFIAKNHLSFIALLYLKEIRLAAPISRPFVLLTAMGIDVYSSKGSEYISLFQKEENIIYLIDKIEKLERID